MDKKPKPIKRSRELAPLSREHHDGLLFVWKLRQGSANGTPLATLQEFCKWYRHAHLDHHFATEEKLLTPHLETVPDLKDQLLCEHEEIRGLLSTIVEEPDTVTIVLLANLLEKHIRFEERILFPDLESRLTPTQLQSILHQLEEEPTCSNDWNIEFWRRKAD